ncbi:lambda exonuclease family protein [Crenobacter cavernae]|uniref:Exonuclease n=1 Tax=Crenobacter cavernae TaxID=2290923 RepID=A0ABY0FDW8_9NEIS|nr:lambda exonuclease family protein [Crenobacter cavernae]RXZ42663.1 exonuclease [Crenobacter cavernae]
MIEQRTDAWREQRAGKITASRFADAIAMNSRTGKPTEARNTYMREIVAEILSGQAKPEISARSLEWGKDVEPFAREAYELERGLVVVESEFLLHPAHDFIGCSPDGLIGDDGGIEMKCPKDPQVHVKTMLECMPNDHIGQVQGCMLVTGRAWWDFVSYDPRETEPYRLYVERIPRDEAFIAELEAGLLLFWQDVQAAIQKIDRNMRIAA